MPLGRRRNALRESWAAREASRSGLGVGPPSDLTHVARKILLRPSLAVPGPDCGARLSANGLDDGVQPTPHRCPGGAERIAESEEVAGVPAVVFLDQRGGHEYGGRKSVRLIL